MSAQNSTPTIDDIQVMTGCLHALLQAVHDVSTEIQYMRPDGSRDPAAEQLNRLIILARDEAKRIDAAVEECNRSRKKKP